MAIGMGTRFRELLARPQNLVIPGGFSPMMARMTEDRRMTQSADWPPNWPGGIGGYCGIAGRSGCPDALLPRAVRRNLFIALREPTIIGPARLQRLRK